MEVWSFNFTCFLHLNNSFKVPTNFIHVHGAFQRYTKLRSRFICCCFLETPSLIIEGRSRKPLFMGVYRDVTGRGFKSKSFHVVFSLSLFLFVEGPTIIIWSTSKRIRSFTPWELVCILFFESDTIWVRNLVSARSRYFILGSFPTCFRENTFDWVGTFGLLCFIKTVLFVESGSNGRIFWIIREIPLDRVIIPSKPSIH